MKLIRQPALRGTPPLVSERVSADKAVETFLLGVGGRDQLLDALEIGSARPEIDKVLDFLADERYASMSLRQICNFAGLTVADLMAAYRSATLIKSQIAATAQIAHRIGPVVADVMRRAAPHEVSCRACNGAGTVSKGDDPALPCLPCRGTGSVVAEPELDRQKLALELAELLKKGGGISITQQQIAVAAGGGDAGDFERMQQALAGLWAAPLDIEAEPELAPAAPFDHSDQSPSTDAPTVIDIQAVAEGEAGVPP